ncbi:hypothetical protein DFJ63DRAFT_336098 [Scheffersomyces coipomensis]|uniref:uncharacterized protein n=1 Tax=Scheffersomyces coipomensis TaxID=1788519 RepID=UPI00315D5822
MSQNENNNNNNNIADTRLTSSIKHNKKTYDKSRFKRILRAKLKENDEAHQQNGVLKPATKKSTLKNDNSDLLIYLIYISYLNELITEGSSDSHGGSGEDGEITNYRIDKAHEMIMKRYRG